MDAAQVQETIDAAFGSLPIPTPGTLIRHLPQRDPEGEERIRRDLAGKSWQSLDGEFLAERWSSFCYLSPTAYRYYLPALLTAALGAFRDGVTLTHAVIYSLAPSYWALYYRGEDADFRAREAVFTEEQYRAVCAFLGLAFDSLPHYRHMAAQALYWGWNGIETPELEAARAYYHRLRNYTWPVAQDPEAEAVCQAIRTAFESTPYPGDDRLCGSEQGDEPAEYALELRGVRWQSAHPELLARCYAALSFLSDAGFRYFLPAYIIADLHDSDSNADPVFHLTHGFADLGIDQGDTDWRQYQANRCAAFTREERLAIIRYLEYGARDEFNAGAIRQALDSYWRLTLEEAPPA